MAAEKLPTQATGANIRSAINTHADEIDGINEALPQKADLSGGKLPVGQLPPIPEENLPDVNIFQQIFDSFEQGTVEIGATGKIQIVGSTPPSEYTLTLNITGLPTDVPVTVNGEVWENRQKSFASGTVISNLTPVASGYSLDPVSVASVTVDANKTLNFTAEETPVSDYTDLIGGYVSGDSSIVTVTQNNLSFSGSQRARNEAILAAGEDGGIEATINTYGVFGFGHGGTALDGRNDMYFGCTKEGNGKITFFSLGSNLFESPAVAGDAVCRIYEEGSEWIGIVNGTEIGRTASLSVERKPHFVGDPGSYINDIKTSNFS